MSSPIKAIEADIVMLDNYGKLPNDAITQEHRCTSPFHTFLKRHLYNFFSNYILFLS